MPLPRAWSQPAYKFSMRSSRGEISLFRPRHQVRPGDPHDDPTPGAVALAVLRRITDRVLAGELVGRLPVYTDQLRELVREKRPPAGLLCELPEHELRFVESFRRARGVLAAAQTDRVNRRLGPLRQIQNFFEGQQAGSVFAIRKDDDRLPADLF